MILCLKEKIIVFFGMLNFFSIVLQYLKYSFYQHRNFPFYDRAQNFFYWICLKENVVIWLKRIIIIILLHKHLKIWTLHRAILMKTSWNWTIIVFITSIKAQMVFPLKYCPSYCNYDLLYYLSNYNLQQIVLIISGTIWKALN